MKKDYTAKRWIPDCFKEEAISFNELDKYSTQFPLNKYVHDCLGDYTKSFTIGDFINRTDDLWDKLKEKGTDIKYVYSTQRFNNEENNEQITVLLIYCQEFVFHLHRRNYPEITLYLNQTSSEEIKEILINNLIWSAKDAKNKQINILLDDNGLDLFSLQTEIPDFISSNYHDIEECWEKTNSLLSNSTKGIILLHGEPGTGKTSFIRSLSKEINKKFIFIPPQFVMSLVKPDFLQFMIKHKDSILILEDAESVLQTRDAGENHSVSNLLNLTDGLLSDLLNIKIICTLNCHVSKIDKAVRRPGRLIYEHEFTKLTASESNSRLSELFPNKGYWTDKPMTISEIYNYESFKKEESSSKIGFNK